MNKMLSYEILEKIVSSQNMRQPDPLMLELTNLKKVLSLLPEADKVGIMLSEIVMASSSFVLLSKLCNTSASSNNLLSLYSAVLDSELPQICSVLSNKKHTQIIDNILNLHVIM